MGECRISRDISKIFLVLSVLIALKMHLKFFTCKYNSGDLTTLSTNAFFKGGVRGLSTNPFSKGGVRGLSTNPFSKGGVLLKYQSIL